MAHTFSTGMKRLASCAVSLLFAGSIHAASQGGELIHTLLECSPKFFSQVRGFPDVSSAGYVFTPKGRLVVRNYRDELGSESRTMGKKELQVGELIVVGMYDRHRKANTFEMLDWGLLVKGEPAQLARKINGLLPPEKSLDSDGVLGFARLDKTTVKTWPKWTMQKPLPQQAPVEFGEIQLVTEISIADEELPNVSRIGCSLQGVFPPFVIQQRRPDID